MANEKSPRRLSSKVRDKVGDQNRQHRPLEVSATSASKSEAKNASEVSVMKGNELLVGDKTDPAAVPRSRSHLQHDGRGSTAQDGRRSGRRMTPEREKKKDYRDEDQVRRRTSGSDPNGKEKPGAWAGESRGSRHDRLSETKNADPPAKKRRQFREEKLPLESEPVGNATPELRKDPNCLNATRDAGRQDDRERNRRPLGRSDYGRAYGRARSFSNGERVERTDMPSRDRFNGANEIRYRGMQMFGGRQAYQRSGGREEKWKHDLYDEANRSPSKNEEDPVAKVEALLSL